MREALGQGRGEARDPGSATVPRRGLEVVAPRRRGQSPEGRWAGEGYRYLDVAIADSGGACCRGTGGTGGGCC
jgi:hypothetical protein